MSVQKKKVLGHFTEAAVTAVSIYRVMLSLVQRKREGGSKITSTVTKDVNEVFQ